MFIASYKNTMRNAKFAPHIKAPKELSPGQIEIAKRRAAALETERQAEVLEARQAEAKRNLEAVKSYRCAVSTGGRIPARKIIEMVAVANGLLVEDILGSSRHRPVIEARFDAVKAVADARPDMSLSQIGRAFGKDHATIFWALKQRGGREAKNV